MSKNSMRITGKGIAEVVEEMLKNATVEELKEMVVDMDKSKDVIKSFYEASDRILDEIGRRNPVTEDFHFQDDDGTVYQLAPWKGQFVVPKDFVIERTRREGETKGTMSMIHARELGYVVEGAGAKPKASKDIVAEAKKFAEGFNAEDGGPGK